MEKRLSKKLLLCFLVVSLLVAPLDAIASTTIEKLGIQTDIEMETEPTEKEITEQETRTSSGKEGEEIFFSIGKIKIVSREIKLKDYSKILAKYENRKVTLNELNELCGAILTPDVRNSGYPAAIVYIPEQNFIQGSDIVLAVLPGRYGEITIDNQTKLPTELFKGFIGNLKAGNIINGLELETAMHKLNIVGGISAAGFLSAGKENGTTDLNIEIRKGKIATEILYAENYGSTSTGRYRYGLQGSVHFPTIPSTLNYAVLISNGGQHNYNLSYDQLFGSSATKVGINISRGDYELGKFRALGAKGVAYTAGLNVTVPLFNSWRKSMDLSFGFTYRKLEDEFEEFGINKLKHTNSFYVGLRGSNIIGRSVIYYDLVHRFGRLDFDNKDAYFFYDATDTRGNYNKTTLDVNYSHAFDRHFEARLKFQGQLAFNNLDSSEEIVLGGFNGVRAYPNGVGAGDEGCIANFELHYHTNVPGLSLFAFLDAGHVKVTHDTSHLSYGTEIAKGWGVGILYVKQGNYFARLDYARRIGDLSYYVGDAESQDKGRIWFTLGKVF